MSARLVETDLSNEALIARDLMAIIAESIEGDEQAAVDMIEGETDLLEALERAVSEIRDCTIIATGCEDAINTLTARKRRAENRKGVIRAAIEQAMVTADQKSIQLPTATLTVSNRKGKPIISEMSEIPSKFFKQPPPVLDRTALADALRNNESVPGASLGNGTVSLTIREK